MQAEQRNSMIDELLSAGISKPFQFVNSKLPVAPQVTIQAVFSIPETIAMGNGNFAALGTPNPTAYGICLKTTCAPTTSDSKVDQAAALAIGDFTASMTGLTAGTNYYVRAYATNTAGTSFGAVETFTTIAICPNPANGGDISAARTICTGETPVALTGTTPTGHSGTLGYKWQSSSNGISFNDILSTSGWENPDEIGIPQYRKIYFNGNS